MKKILLVITIVCLAVLVAYVYAEKVPYDPNTMNYAVSADQAKQAARNWAGNQTLQLEVSGIDMSCPRGRRTPEYILTTNDEVQVFKVCSNTGEIREWTNKSLLGAYHEKLKQSTKINEMLPLSEIDTARITFLSTKYPGWAQYNMEATVPGGSRYAQRLTNGVFNLYRMVICIADEWTGCVCKYIAPASSDAPISAQYTVQSTQSEQNALSHVLNLDWHVGPGSGGSDVKLASAFVYGSPMICISPDKNWTPNLTWALRVVSHVSNTSFNETDYGNYIKDYLLNQGSFENLMSDLLCWNVAIDANTGGVISCDLDSQNKYDPASVATPTCSPDAGTYTGTQTVTMSCSEAGVTIRYTTDGTEPTPTSTLYTAPVTVSSSLTLKARAFKTNLRSSEVKSAAYVIQ